MNAWMGVEDQGTQLTFQIDKNIKKEKFISTLELFQFKNNNKLVHYYLTIAWKNYYNF